MRPGWFVCLSLAGCGFQATALAPDGAVEGTADAGFDRASCPANYSLRPTDSTTAYRLVIDLRRIAKASELDCRDDSAGLTHLATVSDRSELAMLRAEINKLESPPDNNFWIGGIQLRDQANPADGWLDFAGATLLDAWQNTEPNDGDDTENNSENFAMIGTNRDLVDDGGSIRLAICECDGVPIDPRVRALFDTLP